MRLLVLGASGGCGRWLCQLASVRRPPLEAVTALVRPESDFVAPEGVTLVRGRVTEDADIRHVVAGHDTVVSCLGLRRAGKNPWAPLLSPPDLTAGVMRRLLPILADHGVRRLVVISACGVGESRSELRWPVGPILSAGNVGVAYRDLAVMESVLREHAGDLDWLAVRPVVLTDGAPRGRAKPVHRFGLFSTIRRSEVSEWILQTLEQPGPFSKRFVSLGT